jgi:hypothetical protein
MQWSRLLPSRNPAPVMVALVVCWGVFSILWGERLPRNAGFGWDGTIYRSIVQHLWERNDEVTMYHAMRCLPCVVVHYTLKTLGSPLDDAHIFRAFRVYNLFWSVTILLTLLSIADELRLHIQAKWLIFIGLCCSFAHLKQYYYSPIVTDLWGLAFCTLALRSFFKQQRLAVVGWIILGSFTWAIVPIFGAVLILFPYSGSVSHVSPLASADGPRWSARILAALGAVLVAAFAAYVVRVERYYGTPPAQISHRALPLSIVCLALFLYFALQELPYAGLLPRWRDLASLDILRRLGLLAGLFVLLWVGGRLLQPYFSTKQLHSEGPFLFVRLICAYSVAKPLVSLLAQVVFYGPAVILLVLLWRPIVRQAQRYGMAGVLVLTLGLFVSLCSEPRYPLVFYPLFLILLASVLDGQSLGFGRLAALAGIGCFLSKAWLPLNWAPWPPDEPFHYEDVFRFPMQVFFMNHGTWMTTFTYAIQAVVVVVATFIIRYRILPRLSIRDQGRRPRGDLIPNEGVGQTTPPSDLRATA